MLYICGVTFDHTTNYGSCFQAYALQTAIEKMTVDGEKCHYDLLPLATFTDRRKQKKISVLGQIKHVFAKILISLRRHRFQEFEDNYMHYANCHAMKDLPLLNEQYDAFVCGSDVIWNPDFTHGDSTYFLDFARKYKFSYAASFGVADVDKDYMYPKEKCKSLFEDNLSKLNSISVREHAGVTVVERFIGINPEQVCDPVLLIDEGTWRSIGKYNTKREKYIFAYSTYISPNFLKFLSTIRKQTGLKVVHITWDTREAVKHALWRYPSPQVWLGLLEHAEYVVTNSFHGTAFSVLFHKKFFSVMRDKEIKGTRIRLYDFLASMRLGDRIFGITPEVIPLESPDFTVADTRLARIRERSNAYLQKNLKKAYNCKVNDVHNSIKKE